MPGTSGPPLRKRDVHQLCEPAVRPRLDRRRWLPSPVVRRAFALGAAADKATARFGGSSRLRETGDGGHARNARNEDATEIEACDGNDADIGRKETNRAEIHEETERRADAADANADDDRAEESGRRAAGSVGTTHSSHERSIGNGWHARYAW